MNDKSKCQSKCMDGIYLDHTVLQFLPLSTILYSLQIKTLENKIDDKDIALREVHVLLQKSEDKLHSTDKDLGLYLWIELGFSFPLNISPPPPPSSTTSPCPHSFAMLRLLCSTVILS